MFKESIKKIPFLGKHLLSFYSKFFVQRKFTDSATYWENRYQKGGNSGVGSYHKAAAYKAAIINSFVAENSIKTVIEFGCGDGNQLLYLFLPSYIGFDVSQTAVSRCRDLFQSDPSKRFALLSSYANEKADLTLSLDVLYHLVEDPVFDRYGNTVFGIQ